jgi:hypothetical protein
MAKDQVPASGVVNKDLTKVENNPFLATISITKYKPNSETQKLLDEHLAETKKAFKILDA